MSNKCPTCSQSGAERSNPQGEARCGEPASRNAIELDSASLHKVGAANLPDWMKPAIVGEAALECSRWAPRGDWRQRVGKEKSSNLGDPADGSKGGVVHRSSRRKSEGIVVAGKQGNSCGAKGSCCKCETIGPIHSRLPVAITGENVYVTDRIRIGDDERLQESRMREIRTSGLTRGSSGNGESRPLLSTLLVKIQLITPASSEFGFSGFHLPI
jgi:hypothetical protein